MQGEAKVDDLSFKIFEIIIGNLIDSKNLNSMERNEKTSLDCYNDYPVKDYITC